MAFDQKKLDRSVLQSRGIFNKYVYDTNDSIATVQTAGYFSESRFALTDNDSTNGMGWNGGVIECQCSDGYVIGVMDSSTGTLTAANVANPTGLTQSLCQVSITHPSPAFLVPVTGTTDPDLDPVTYASSFVDVLNGYSENLNEGSAFTVLADGRVQINTAGLVNGTAYADVAQSVNNSTIGAVFSIERGASTILTPRSVHSRLPNAGDIGNISGTGAFNAQIGDIVGIAIASDLSGNVSFRSSSLVFEMFTQG